MSAQKNGNDVAQGVEIIANDNCSQRMIMERK
jgi:hypothetical protein